MIHGKSIVELATEIQRQADAKRDYLVSTELMHVADDAKHIMVNGLESGIKINQHAHRQICDRVGIPFRYYDRMLEEAPQLLANNVNHWFANKPEQRMLRTMDGQLRAFLSDRYRRIDNDFIAEAVLPVLLGSNDIRVMSSEITDRRLYIQVVFPKLETEVKKGDAVQSGIVISNSEIGSGGFSISPLIFRLACTNGMITSHAMNKYHVGRQVSTIEDSYEVFSDETIKADDKALTLKITDLVRASMDQATFLNQVEVLRQTTLGVEIENPVKAVELLSQRMGLSGFEQNSVLKNLIKDGDLSRYGMIQAVTAVANSHASYDRAIELESLGGRLLELKRDQWEELAEAA